MSTRTSARTRLIAGCVSLAVLALVALASIATVLPPEPARDTADTSRFVAARAIADVRAVGSEVHVAGSAAAESVREYIVGTLADLGYAPEVREGIGATSNLGGPAMAHTHNITVHMPGSASTGRLIVMAHYDSVQISYGANDDGSGVATLLEIARVLAAAEPLRNDVVLLFTDAEEACLCGAESFVHSDPLGADGGVVLNFEARGGAGPSVMFETGQGNADLVAQYAAAAPYPVATSMAVEVYRILPNDTDFTPFRESGRFTGLNSAYIDGVAVYHSPQDRPERVNLGTLQQHGDNALALTQQLGNADLGPLAVPAAHDATYFPVLGMLVQYPGTMVWPWAILAALSVIVAGWLLVRRSIAGPGRLAVGAALMLVPLVVAAVVAQLFWVLLVALRPGYQTMIDPWQPSWFRLAVCALAALVVVGWYAAWRRRVGASALQFGALVWLAGLGITTAALIPGGSYLVALPALAGGLATIVTVAVRLPWIDTVAHLLAATVAVVILVPTVLLFFPALGLATGAAAALFVALLVFAALPILELLHPAPAASRLQHSGGAPSAGPAVSREGDPRTARRRAVIPSAITAALAVALSVIGLAVDEFDEDHPLPTQLMYAMDADSGAAWWASEQDSADGWLAQYVTASTDLSQSFPILDGTLLTGPAEPAALRAPVVSVEHVGGAGDGTTTFDFKVQPQRSVRLLEVSSPDATVVRATVEAGAVSRDVPLSDGPFDLLFHAPPADGVTIRFTLQGSSGATFRVLDGSDGLADLPGFVPRPPDVGVKGSHTSELLLVATSVRVGPR